MSSVSNQSNSDDRNGDNKDNSSHQVSQGTAIHPTMQQQQAMSALVFKAVADAAINSGGIRARTVHNGPVAAISSTVVSSTVVSSTVVSSTDGKVAGEEGMVYYAGRLYDSSLGISGEDTREEWGKACMMRE